LLLQTAVLSLAPGDLLYGGLLAVLPLTAGLAWDAVLHHRARGREAERVAELAGIRAELARAHEMAREHDDDTAALIHEAKTPLSVLKLAVRGNSGVPRGWEEELDRLEQILETGLFASRVNSFASDYLLQDMDLRALCAQTAARFAPAFLSRRLKFSMAEGTATALTDPKWLACVLSQLLSNALKYVPEGGEVRVTIVGVPSAPQLAVEDNGPGLAPEDLPRLFDRGFTGHSRRTVQATGLGLYLAARLCAKLGHRLTAENRPEGGARFVVAFPSTGDLSPL
jgi:signal transduction histidine kinase